MYTFTRNERLSNYRLKSLLFDKGDSFFHYPFRVIFLSVKREEADVLPNLNRPLSWVETFQFPVQLLVAVPGKRVKRATKRNRVKRLTKEAYRKNKISLYSLLEEKGMVCLLGLVYAAREPVSYEVVEKSVSFILTALQEKIREQEDNTGERAYYLH